MCSSKALVEAVEHKFQFAAGSLEHVFQSWTLGLAFLKVGEVGKARERLTTARNGFGKADMQLHFAMASMDLAILENQLGRHAAVIRISGELFPVLNKFRRREAALAALRLFVQSLPQGSKSQRSLSEL